jgi:hypothetical protein
MNPIKTRNRYIIYNMNLIDIIAPVIKDRAQWQKFLRIETGIYKTGRFE